MTTRSSGGSLGKRVNVVTDIEVEVETGIVEADFVSAFEDCVIEAEVGVLEADKVSVDEDSEVEGFRIEADAISSIFCCSLHISEESEKEERQ